MRGLRELALFAGAGGGLLASRILQWSTRCAVEVDPYCRSVLLARQRDGFLERFPIWDDVETFDARPWRGHIDVVSGGFPCQDISSAGSGAGLSGKKSGLWFEMLRLIGEVEPAWVFIENSDRLRTRGLGSVLSGLAALGFDASWGVLSAKETGAPQIRRRMWIVAHHHRQRDVAVDAEVARTQKTSTTDGAVPGEGVHPSSSNKTLRLDERREGREGSVYRFPDWWPVDSLEGVDDGLAGRVGDRIRATGNGQVPRVAALAFTVLARRLLK